MVWVSIALAIVLLFLLVCHFIRIKFTVKWQSLNSFQTTFGFSFLQWEQEITFNGGQDRNASVKSMVSDYHSPIANDPGFTKPTREQAGFIRLPQSLTRAIHKFRRHLKKTLIKLALDPRVWRFVIKYVMGFARRGFHLLHIRLEYLAISFDDILLLGKFAAVWSSLAGMITFLACPVQYGFNEKPASIRLGMDGGFTVLNLIGFGILALFSFPWVGLAKRFWVSWRNPELNRWQRRLLLF
jgi:hypothetical protein